MHSTLPKYAQRYPLGPIVQSRTLLHDEHDQMIPAGPKLRVVAIAPKVRCTSKESIRLQPELYDSNEYFLDLVRAEPELDCPRIRTHFVTVRKVKP